MNNKIGFHSLQLIKDYGISTPVIISPISGSTLYVGSIQAVTSSAYPLTSAGVHLSSNWELLDGSTTLWVELNNTTDLTSLNLSIYSSYPSLVSLKVQYNGQVTSSSWSSAVNLNLEYCTPSSPTAGIQVYQVSNAGWTSWANTYSIWISPGGGSVLVGNIVNFTKTINLNAGTYTLKYTADDDLQIVMDSSMLLPFDILPYGANVGSTQIFNHSNGKEWGGLSGDTNSVDPGTLTFTLTTSGSHTFTFYGYNQNITHSTVWSTNPAGIAIVCYAGSNWSGSIAFTTLDFIGSPGFYCPNGTTYSSADNLCHCYSP